MRALEHDEGQQLADEFEDLHDAVQHLFDVREVDPPAALPAGQATVNVYYSFGDADKRRAQFLVKFLEGVNVESLDAVLEHTDPTLLAQRLTRTIGQGPSAAAAAVGPVFTAAGLAEWKGVSKEALRKAQKAGRVLGFKSRDGVLLYPQFQFNEYGDYLPALKDVLAIIDPQRLDDGSSAVWLNRTYPSLDGRTAAQALHDGDTDKVLHLAREIGWVWQEAS